MPLKRGHTRSTSLLTAAPAYNDAHHSSAWLTLEELRTFVACYFVAQYEDIYFTPFSHQRKSSVSAYLNCWLQIANFYVNPRSNLVVCEHLRILKDMLEQRDLDTGLLEPPLRSLRHGHGMFQRHGREWHVELARRGRVQDLATCLLAEKMLVERLWPTSTRVVDRAERRPSIGARRALSRTLSKFKLNEHGNNDCRRAAAQEKVLKEVGFWFQRLGSLTDFELTLSGRALVNWGYVPPPTSTARPPKRIQIEQLAESIRLSDRMRKQRSQNSPYRLSLLGDTMAEEQLHIHPAFRTSEAGPAFPTVPKAHHLMHRRYFSLESPATLRSSNATPRAANESPV